MTVRHVIPCVLLWTGLSIATIAAPSTAPATLPTTKAAAPATVPAPLPILKLDEVVAKLTAESEKLMDPDQTFYFSRPHPIVQQLEPDKALRVLARIAQPFTGDPLRDTYIRYHLLWVVLQDANSHNEFSSKKFAEMVNSLPGEVTYEVKQARSWDHPEIATRYYQLVTKLYV